MVNPVLLQKKKVDDVEDINTNSIMKRSFDEINDETTNTRTSTTKTDLPNKRLAQFQSEILEENVDYMALKSSLSLLLSRAATIKRDMVDLNNFKKSIYQTEDGKSLHQLILNNSDYLNEINYKGCCVKCPTIAWNQNYGLNIEVLNDESYETINENYEILKKDKLFK